MKSGRSDPLKLGRLDLSCKANNFSDVGTRGLDVLPSHEISICDAGSTHPGGMPPQVQVSMEYGSNNKHERGVLLVYLAKLKDTPHS